MKFRDIATPLTIGAFAMMAVTGLLMFFHFDTGLNKPLHEWASWLMVGAVVAHVYINWLPFKRYFMQNKLASGLMAACVLVLGLSFLPPPGGAEAGGPPPVLAMRAVSTAPLASLAPLTGQRPEQMLANLAEAGITLPNAEASLSSVIGNNRDLQGKAMQVLFQKP